MICVKSHFKHLNILCEFSIGLVYRFLFPYCVLPLSCDLFEYCVFYRLVLCFLHAVLIFVSLCYELLKFCLEVCFVVFHYVNIFLRLLLDIVLPSVVFSVNWTLWYLVKSLHMFKKKKTGKTDQISWLFEVALKVSISHCVLTSFG